MPKLDTLDDLKDDFKLHSFTTGKDGGVTSERHVLKGRPDDEVVHIPDPATIARTSTLYGPDGEVRAQWVIEKPEDKQRLAVWREIGEELKRDVRVVPLICRLAPAIRDDLLACYPVGDHHLGMLAWHQETNADYDLEIGERLLGDAIDHLISVAQPCRQAAVVFLGDFLHYDGFVPQTPQSKNPLDADGRFPKMVRTAIRTMRRAVEAALQWHENVRVIIEIGNHDLASSIWLMELMAHVYSENPRVSVDTSPRHFHYLRFGKNLVGTHHGDTVKTDKLPLIMAADRPDDWGSTEHRYWWTGHIHQKSVNDYAGCSVESFRILPPNDAWASKMGYRSKRDMTAIVLHKDYGEVARHIVNPAMLERN